MSAIRTELCPDRVVVRVGERVLVDTSRAILLLEGSRAPVVYVPREDADMTQLERSATTTRCPWKGTASYFSIRDGARDAVWSYETPNDEAAGIAGHLAFYPQHVSLERRPT